MAPKLLKRPATQRNALARGAERRCQARSGNDSDFSLDSDVAPRRPCIPRNVSHHSDTRFQAEQGPPAFQQPGDIWSWCTVFLDLMKGKGSFTENYEDTPQVIHKLLRDQVTELAASRAFVFDKSHKQVRAILLKAGVNVSPTVMTEKKEPHGGVKMKNDEVVYRMCTDCSHGEHPPNSQIHSSDHTRQKTTSPSTVAHKLLKEEKKHPNHPVL